MDVQRASIQALPDEAVAQIKSSVAITDLNGVVVDLVKNSLDAGAQSVCVTVDFQRGGCVVEDDGCGIPPAEFREHGGLVKLHHTSKFNSSTEVYGCKGTFLASLSALSLLTITSRHLSDSSTNTVIFHHSKAVSRLLPAPTQHRLDYGDHGTRVTVTDLFGNMPVRVKHRAMTLRRSEDLDREWEGLKRMLTGLLVALTRRIRLVVTDISRTRRVAFRANNMKPPSSSFSRSGSSSRSIDLDNLRTILSHAGYITPRDFESWVSASARTSNITVQSAISLKPSPTKQIQFISFGINPIFSQANANVLYDEVNRLFSLSSFGTTDGIFVPTEELKGLRIKDELRAEDGVGPRREHITTKDINRWPMFYIRIDVQGPGLSIDQEDSLEQSKSLQTVLDVIGAMIRQFLEQYHFRPWPKSRAKRPRKESPPSDETMEKEPKRPKSCVPEVSDAASSVELGFPRNDVGELAGSHVKLPVLPSVRPAQPSRQSSDFGSWSRVKSGNRHGFEDICSGLPRGKLSSAASNRTPLSREDGSRSEPRPSTPQTVRLPSDHPTPDIQQAPPVPASGNGKMGDIEEISDEVIRWINPITKEPILINSRTGQTLPTVNQRSGQRSVSTCEHRCLSHPRATDSTSKSGEWFDTLMKEWDNPIFPSSENPVATVPFAVPEGPDYPSPGLAGTKGLTSSGKFNGKLTKSGIREAEVVAQVDNKFILVKMRPSSEEDKQQQLLLLVDQHAADERCQVEQLFRELCCFPRPDATSFAIPLSFTVSSQDARLLRIYEDYFASWGCHYALSVDHGNSHLVTVNKLPTLIAERCRQEPSLVRNMLRNEVWSRENEGRRHPGTVASTSPEASWLERISDCPKGIIDMLNSRACRSAIMFNDPLSRNDCKNLMARLALCAFPFHCAHGRPSMVPIVSLGTSTSTNVGSAGFERLSAFDSASKLSDPQNQVNTGPPFSEAFNSWLSTRDSAT